MVQQRIIYYRCFHLWKIDPRAIGLLEASLEADKCGVGEKLQLDND